MSPPQCSPADACPRPRDRRRTVSVVGRLGRDVIITRASLKDDKTVDARLDADLVVDDTADGSGPPIPPQLYERWRMRRPAIPWAWRSLSIRTRVSEGSGQTLVDTKSQLMSIKLSDTQHAMMRVAAQRDDRLLAALAMTPAASRRRKAFGRAALRSTGFGNEIASNAPSRASSRLAFGKRPIAAIPQSLSVAPPPIAN